jgi:3-methyladenine DNA glycosylase Tag
LSAATDNAKELILARINSGTNFARMYIFGFIMGFDVDDLVSFMTSDVSEFIDSQANRNVFSNNSTFKNASMAINLAQGIVGHSKFLHGSYYEYDPDTDESYTTAKSTYVANRVLEYVGEDKIKNWIAEHDGVNVDDINSVPLSKAMRAAINLALSDTNINLREIEVNDIEMN